MSESALRRGLRRWIAMSWCFIVIATASGSADAGKGNITITLQAVEIREVMDMLSRQERANILVGEGVGGKISVNLYDVDLDQAVRSIAAAAGYAVEYRGGSYFIVDRDEVGKYGASGLTEIRSFKVQYTDTDVVEGILKKHLSSYGNITKLGARQLLVVEDLPPFIERIEKLLAQIDRQPRQVLIEAQILEIKLTDNQAFGIDWSKFFTASGGDGSFGVQGLNQPTAPGLFFKLFTPNIAVTLNALKERGRLRTLSTPKLLAMENHEAEVILGDNTGYRVTTTINQVTTESIEFLESGVILKVKPAVDGQGRIMLYVHPEISTASVSDDGIPSKKTTQVTTSMLLPDGQTAFIAGLISHNTNETREGVPILGDIPLLGRIFSNQAKSILNVETVVLITPKIIEQGSSQWVAGQVRRMDEQSRILHGSARQVDAKMDKLMGKAETLDRGPSEPASPKAPGPASGGSGTSKSERATDWFDDYR